MAVREVPQILGATRRRVGPALRERCWPPAAHAQRSETPNRSHSRSTATRRRSGVPISLGQFLERRLVQFRVRTSPPSGLPRLGYGALQDRTRPPPRTLEGTRRPRTRNAGMGRLVQPPTTPPSQRPHPTSRSRRPPLPSTTIRRSIRHSRQPACVKSGEVQVQCPVISAVWCASDFARAACWTPRCGGTGGTGGDSRAAVALQGWRVLAVALSGSGSGTAKGIETCPRPADHRRPREMTILRAPTVGAAPSRRQPQPDPLGRSGCQAVAASRSRPRLRRPIDTGSTEAVTVKVTPRSTGSPGHAHRDRCLAPSS